MHRTLDPAMAGRSPGRSPGRRWTVVAMAVVSTVVAALVWWSTWAATDPMDAAEYEAAVALEGGVRPMVTDRAGDLGVVTAVTVKRTPDPDLATVHLLAPIGEERARLSVVSETTPADETVDLVVDGVLPDGRVYETFRDTGRYVSLATIGAEGQYVEVMGRDLSFDELVHHTAEVEVGHAGVVRLPADWVELASAPMPPWREGIGTYYDFADGRRLGIAVERAHPGREALVAFADAESVDLGTGGWAYRRRPPWVGLMFRSGDVVVDLTGEFSDAEFVAIAHSLRLMRPGELPIAEPDPYPF